jgi:hypothetical protein
MYWECSSISSWYENMIFSFLLVHKPLSTCTCVYYTYKSFLLQAWKHKQRVDLVLCNNIYVPEMKKKVLNLIRKHDKNSIKITKFMICDFAKTAIIQHVCVNIYTNFYQLQEWWFKAPYGHDNGFDQSFQYIHTHNGKHKIYNFW